MTWSCYPWASALARPAARVSRSGPASDLAIARVAAFGQFFRRTNRSSSNDLNC